MCDCLPIADSRGLIVAAPFQGLSDRLGETDSGECPARLGIKKAGMGSYIERGLGGT